MTRMTRPGFNADVHHCLLTYAFSCLLQCGDSMLPDLAHLLIKIHSQDSQRQRETSTDRSRLILSIPKVYLSLLDHPALPVIMLCNNRLQAAHMACKG